MQKGKKMRVFATLLLVALSWVNLLHLLWTVWLTVEQTKTGWGYGTDMEMLALLPWMTELLSAPVLLAGVVYGIISIFFRHEKRLMVTNALLFALAAAQIGLTNLFLFC